MPFFSSFSGANSFGRTVLSSIPSVPQVQRSITNITPNGTIGRFAADVNVKEIFDFQIVDGGTKLFHLSTTPDSIISYDISTPYQLSSVNRISKKSKVFGGTINSFYVKPDGTKLYLLTSYDNFRIWEYSLSIPFDLNSIGAQVHSFLISGIAPKELRFSSDGLYLYYVEGVDDTRRITLSTAWDTTSLSDFPTNTENSIFYAPSYDIKDDGTKIITAFRNPTTNNDDYDSIYLVEANLNTPYVMSPSLVRFTPFGNGIRWPRNQYYEHISIKMPDDQPYVYVADSDQAMIYQFTATANFNASAPVLTTYTGEILATDLQVDNADEASVDQQFYIDPTGTYLFISNIIGVTTNAKYKRYDMATPWDLSTAVDSNITNPFTSRGNDSGIFFKSDGTKVYVIDTAVPEVDAFNLSTPWDLSSVGGSASESLTGISSTARNIFFNSAGTQLWLDNIRYTLATPWDISTATSQGLDTRFPTGSSYWVDDDEKFFHSISFTEDEVGYTVTLRENNIEENDLINVGSADDHVVRNMTSRPLSIFFKPDREKMFILDRTGVVTSYTLPDISTGGA